MEKPVVILGGGIWGSLLAYRLKEMLPEVNFILYEACSTLGQHQSCSFRESDCKESMPWLKPLISQSWSNHHVKLAKFEKWITDPYHLIESKKLNEIVTNKLGPDNVRLNNRVSTEMALIEGSFVIDTRNICHYAKTGYRKCLSMEVELTDAHHLIAPVIFDDRVEKKEHFRHLQYLPLDSHKILVKDFWYSNDQYFNREEMQESLAEALSLRGWKVSKVIKEDFSYSRVPTSPPNIRQDGRVINLAGIFHDSTGCSIPLATKLIDRMVATSFRFGELREVVKNYRSEIEGDRNFFRFLNRQLLEKNQHHLFEAIYNQSYSSLERYSRGKLNIWDRYQILLGKTNYQITHLIQFLLRAETSERSFRS